MNTKYVYTFILYATPLLCYTPPVKTLLGVFWRDKQPSTKYISLKLIDNYNWGENTHASLFSALDMHA